MIRECCQAHYGLIVGSRYECMPSKRHPGQHLMFKPNPDKPIMTMVVDCECPCHNKGGTTMATKKKATKKKVSKKKASKKKVEKKTRQPGKERLAYLAGKIKVLAKKNPKREGSASYERFELYKKHKTIDDYLNAGGTQRDLDWDMEKGFISFKTYKSY